MTQHQIEAEGELELNTELQKTNFNSFEQALPQLKDIHSKYQT